MRNTHKAITVTIASGAALSDEIILDGYELFAVQMPAAWTAAALSYQAKGTVAGALADVVLTGSEITDAVTVDQYVLLTNPVRAYSVKLRSGVTATPVNQGGARELVAMLRALR